MPRPIPNDPAFNPEVETDQSASRGNTFAAQGETDTLDQVPRLPHERDQSADSQTTTVDPTTRRMGELALADLEQGKMDTSRRPVMDKVYDKVREGAADPVKKDPVEK